MADEQRKIMEIDGKTDGRYINDITDIGDTTPQQEDEPVDEEALERREDEGGCSEPACWRDLFNEPFVRAERNSNEENGEENILNEILRLSQVEARNRFLHKWTMRKSTEEISTSGLTCLLCSIYLTIELKLKGKKWGSKHLNIHLRNGTHFQRSQMFRAFKITAKSAPPSRI